MEMLAPVLIVLAVVLIVVLATAALWSPRRRAGREKPGGEISPPTVEAPGVPAEQPLETPEPTASRLVRLRARLSRSQSGLGRRLLQLLAADRLDDEAWEDIEDALLGADVGVTATQAIVARLRERTAVLGTKDPDELRQMVTGELTAVLEYSAGGAMQPFDRELRSARHADRPAVILVVGVNGVG